MEMCNISIPKWFGGFVVLAIPGIVLAGPRLYVSDTLSDTVTVIDTATNTRVGDPIQMPHSRPLAPVVSPDGSRVYVQSVDGPIDVIDAATLTVTQTIDDPNPGSSDGAWAMTVMPDGHAILTSAAGQGTIAITYSTTGSTVAHVAPEGDPQHIASLRVSHDGKRLYALDAVDFSITAMDVPSGLHTVGKVTIQSGGSQDQLMGMAVSLDDRTLYAITYYGALVRIDTDSMTITSSDTVGVASPDYGGVPLYGIALQPDGSHAFAVQFGATCLFDIDLGASSSASATSLSTNNACFSVAAGRDGRHAYVASSDVAGNSYSVVALDPADDAAAISLGTFAYPNFDDQSIDASGATLTPRAGLWWTPGQPGSALQIEVQDDTLVVVASTYDENGASTWRMASGPFDGANGTFEGDFVRYDGGSCLGCAYRAPMDATPDGGRVSIAFTSAIAGSMTIAGTTIPIAKYGW